VQQALDIYIKLLIAIISFIAPLLINLLSIFSEGAAVKKRKLTEFESQTANILREQINAAGANIAELVKENGDVFKQKAEESTKQLELLDPKKQIIAIFPTFFYSLVLILIFQLALDDTIAKHFNDDVVRVTKLVTFVGSIYFAVKGVEILKNVTWAVIDVKKEMAEQIEKESPKSEKIEPPKEEKQ
jgi:hypothetical protein